MCAAAFGEALAPACCFRARSSSVMDWPWHSRQHDFVPPWDGDPPVAPNHFRRPWTGWNNYGPTWYCARDCKVGPTEVASDRNRPLPLEPL